MTTIRPTVLVLLLLLTAVASCGSCYGPAPDLVPEAEAASFYLQKGPHNDARPTMAALTAERRNSGNTGWEQYSPFSATDFGTATPLGVRGRRRVTFQGGINTGWALIEAMNRYTVVTSGVRTTYADESTHAQFSTLSSGIYCATCGAVASGTHYFFYAYFDGTNTVFDRDTVAPDAMLATKSTDTSRAYMFRIMTPVGSSRIVTMSMVDGKYVFAPNPAVVVANPAVADTCVSLTSADIPTTAKAIQLNLIASCGATPGTLGVYFNSGCTVPICTATSTLTTVPAERSCEIPYPNNMGTGFLLYTKANASCIGTSTVVLTGFTE